MTQLPPHTPRWPDGQPFRVWSAKPTTQAPIGEPTEAERAELKRKAFEWFESQGYTLTDPDEQADQQHEDVLYELYFPAEMDRELREMKERTGNSVASYIRNAVRAALDRDNA